MIDFHAATRPLIALRRSLQPPSVPGVGSGAKKSKASKQRPKQGGRSGRKSRQPRDAWRKGALESKSAPDFLTHLVSLRGSALLAEELAGLEAAPLVLSAPSLQKAQDLFAEVCKRLDGFEGQLAPVFEGRIDVINPAKAKRLLRGQAATATGASRARAFTDVFADFSRMHFSNIYQSIAELRLEIAPRFGALSLQAAALERADAALSEAMQERVASLYDALVDVQSAQLYARLQEPLTPAAPDSAMLETLFDDAGPIVSHRKLVGLAAQAVYRMEEGRLRALVRALSQAPTGAAETFVATPPSEVTGDEGASSLGSEALLGEQA